MADAPSNTLYAQVVSSLEDQILSGALKNGERLKNERWLCEQYGVSRTTLRKAIDELILRGLVERRANKGVFVTNTQFDSGFDRPYSIFQELQRAGITPSSTILSFTRIRAGAALSRQLGCHAKDAVLEIHRLRMADGVPFSIQEMYLPERLVPKLNPWLLTERSLYDVMSQEYGLQIDKSEQVVNTTSANRQQAELLSIAVNSPLLVTYSTVHAKSGEILCTQKSTILTSVVPYSYKFMWVR